MSGHTHTIELVVVREGDDWRLRIFEELRERFLEDDGFWAGLFAIYGDPRAVPLLEGALSTFEPDFADMMSRMQLRELLDAHQRLGGMLAPQLHEQIEGWFDEWATRFSRPAARRKKIGRNDPCPCGSGKKYKRCCIDARGRSSAPAAATTAPDPGRLFVGGDVGERNMAVAKALFGERDAGRGPAQQMVDYPRPLLDSTDGSLAETESMLNLSIFLWNAALMNTDEREAMLTELASKYESDLREEFWKTAHMMIKRHAEMFPEMHQRRV